MNFKRWLARKLLSFVNKLEPDCKGVYDAKERWMFKRDWTQPVRGGKDKLA